jgi:hypothetical protein
MAMPRQLRIEYPGAIYHVLNRGDQREEISRDDEDRQRFANTLGGACGNAARHPHTPGGTASTAQICFAG